VTRVVDYSFWRRLTAEHSTWGRVAPAGTLHFSGRHVVPAQPTLDQPPAQVRHQLQLAGRSANTVPKPSADGANGPLTRTRIALFIIGSSPHVVVEEKSRHKRV
jgi:hypothetical protein